MVGHGVASIDATTNHRDFYVQVLNGYSGWSLKSLETGIVTRYLIDGSYTDWAWYSLAHTSITMQGSPLIGTTVSVTQETGTSSIAAGGISASFSLAFEVTFTFSCTCTGDTPIRPLVKKRYPFFYYRPL